MPTLPPTKFYHIKPLIFAHRGARRQAPENTLPAFQRAVELACDGIELDVQRCQSGEIIVFHDQRLGRIGEGSAKIADLPLSELRKIDVGVHFSPEFVGIGIPTLDEVFEAVGQKLLINVEIKFFANEPEIAPAVTSIVQRHNMEQRVMISSFNPFSLRHVRKTAPTLPVGFLHEAATPAIFRSDWVLRRLIGHYEARHPNFRSADRRYIEWAHRQGYRVNVWTVNEADDINHMLDLGVDLIISDVPDLALSLRSAHPTPNGTA